MAIVAVLAAIHTNRIRQAAMRRDAFLQLVRQPGVYDCLHTDELDEYLRANSHSFHSIFARLGVDRDDSQRLAVFKLHGNANPIDLLTTAHEIGHLRWVNLVDCDVDSQTFEKLKSIESLERLDLSYSQFEERQLNQCLQELNLKVLDLRGPQISEELLSDLAACRSLRYLYLQQTTISGDAVARLEESLPMCRIFTNGDKNPVG